MFITASVFVVLAALAAWFAHKQAGYQRSETSRLLSIVFGVLAVLFVAGGVLKWGSA